MFKMYIEKNEYNKDKDSLLFFLFKLYKYNDFLVKLPDILNRLIIKIDIKPCIDSNKVFVQ